MHPRIREVNDYIQKGLNEVAEELRQEEAHRELHFTTLYGPSLGKAAARFASLGRLDSYTEATERRDLAEQVAATMADPAEPITEHPIIAVIEATELRTTMNQRTGSSLNLPFRPKLTTEEMLEFSIDEEALKSTDL